jgi:hypothetical protein
MIAQVVETGKIFQINLSISISAVHSNQVAKTYNKRLVSRGEE